MFSVRLNLDLVQLRNLLFLIEYTIWVFFVGRRGLPPPPPPHSSDFVPSPNLAQYSREYQLSFYGKIPPPSPQTITLPTLRFPDIYPIKTPYPPPHPCLHSTCLYQYHIIFNLSVSSCFNTSKCDRLAVMDGHVFVGWVFSLWAGVGSY